MNRLHTFLAGIVPEPRRRWILGHAAELDAIDDRRARLRWMVGLLPLTTHALAAQLLCDPGSFLGGRLARLGTGALSVANLAGGVVLLAVSAAADLPILAAMPGAVLVTQGGYTLVHLRGAPRMSALQNVGSLVAAVLGMAAAAIGLALTVGAADPEYGPPTVAAAIALHGLVSLAAFTTQARR